MYGQNPQFYSRPKFIDYTLCIPPLGVEFIWAIIYLLSISNWNVIKDCRLHLWEAIRAIFQHWKVLGFTAIVNL